MGNGVGGFSNAIESAFYQRRLEMNEQAKLRKQETLRLQDVQHDDTEMLERLSRRQSIKIYRKMSRKQSQLPKVPSQTERSKMVEVKKKINEEEMHAKLDRMKELKKIRQRIEKRHKNGGSDGDTIGTKGLFKQKIQEYLAKHPEKAILKKQAQNYYGNPSVENLRNSILPRLSNNGPIIHDTQNNESYLKNQNNDHMNGYFSSNISDSTNSRSNLYGNNNNKNQLTGTFDFFTNNFSSPFTLHEQVQLTSLDRLKNQTKLQTAVRNHRVGPKSAIDALRMRANNNRDSLADGAAQFRIMRYGN